MKEMSKAKIIYKKSENYIISERNILNKMSHPFIVNMYYSFQNQDNLYLVLDLMTGGDLRYHLTRLKRVSEIEGKFLISNIILALEYIHINKIVHRDIKPENLVMDQKGYIHLTDFGIAKKIENNYIKENNSSGTPGYVAPEILCGNEYNFSVDYFALGIVTYELITGERPYTGSNKLEIKEKMISKQIQLKKINLPIGWSLESLDFVNKLIQRKPLNRLGGKNGIIELKNHPWLKDIQWNEIYLKKIKPHFIPREGDNFSYKYCNKSEVIDNKTKELYNIIMNKENYNEIFIDYKYFNIEDKYSFNIKSTFINPHEMYDIIEKENIRKNNLIKEKEENISFDNNNNNNLSNCIASELLNKYTSNNNNLNNFFDTNASTSISLFKERNRRTNSFDYFYHNKMFYQNKYNQKIVNNLKISNNTMINLKNFVKKQKQNNFYNSNINNNLKQ